MEVGKEERLDHLTALMQTFLSTMADIGAETWIIHGTLLGWWWNQKVRTPDITLIPSPSHPFPASMLKYDG
jgi:hypothetical protein